MNQQVNKIKANERKHDAKGQIFKRIQVCSVPRNGGKKESVKPTRTSLILPSISSDAHSGSCVILARKQKLDWVEYSV